MTYKRTPNGVCLNLEELQKITEEAKKQGLEVFTTGGRYPEIIEYDPNRYQVIYLPARGWYEQLDDNIVVIAEHGNIYAITGKVVDEIPDSPHGCWKVKKNQLDIVIDTSYTPQKSYLIAEWGLGSYATSGIWIYNLETGEKIYEVQPESDQYTEIPASELIIAGTRLITPFGTEPISETDATVLRKIQRTKPNFPIPLITTRKYSLPSLTIIGNQS